MPPSLLQLQNTLREMPTSRCEAPQPYGMSIYRCHQPQKLHDIPFTVPTLMMVVKGEKRALMESRQFSVSPGEILLLPSDVSLQLGSFPEQHSDLYLGIAVRFSPGAVDHFRKQYGKHYQGELGRPIWHMPADETVTQGLLQWVAFLPQIANSPSLNQHRQVELLLLLAEQGVVENLLSVGELSWRKRVVQVLTRDPSHPWQLNDLCVRLRTSESSLRRRLQAEQTSFRELLEEVRLGTGLSLLFETSWPIGRIAEAVGYQSQSRFGERIKARFGMTPSEIRNTMDESGEQMVV